MQSTLAERLREAMDGPPKVTGIALAKACQIEPPSVSGWLSGKSKSMEASNCLAAARLLNVDPNWLATGIGQKERLSVAPHVAAPGANYQWTPPPSPWPFDGITDSDYKKLSEFDRGQVEGFIKGLLQANRRRLKSGEAASD